MTDRLRPGCWWKFSAKCPILGVVVQLYTGFSSGCGWVILLWVEELGFWFLTPISPWVLQIAPHGHSPLISAPCAPAWQIKSVPIRGVCVCVCVCVCVYMGGGGCWWGVGKERKYDGDNGSIWFHIFAEFFISCLDLDFGNPKSNTLAFFPWCFHDNFPWWPVMLSLSFSGGWDSEESTCNAGDPGSIPGLRRSRGGGNGYPLRYSCLKNSMDRGAWWATVHGLTKSRTQVSD